MSEKVKEILEALKPLNDDILKDYPLTLSIEEQKLLLDYITNLQKENKRLKESVNNLLKLCEEVIKENEGLYNHLCLEMRKNDGGDEE